MNKLFYEICTQIDDCIDEFDLIPNNKVAVGVSGGKDSSILLLALTHLGFSVFPIVVDMGFKGFSLEGINKHFAPHNISAHVINVESQCIRLPDDERQEVELLLKELSFSQATKPCTACSRIKRIFLFDYARRIGIRTIALGHHRDDFIATMMKEGTGGRYDFVPFSSTVKQHHALSMIFLEIPVTLSI